MLRGGVERGATACYGIAAVAWLILLAGLSAMQDTYGAKVRSIMGLPWFILCFQLVALVLLVPHQTLCPARLPVALHQHTIQAFLAVAATLCILMTDRFCGDFPFIQQGRSNTVLAGFLITSVMDLLLIGILGCGDAHMQELASPTTRRTNTAAAPAMPAKTAAGTSTATAVSAQSGIAAEQGPQAV